MLVYFEKKSGINFTNRSATHQVSAGSGHLVFEAPVVQSFNRRIKELDDYGKTLSALGLSSKQETLRIRFEKTEVPFQDVAERSSELLGEGALLKESSSATSAPSSQPTVQQTSAESVPVEESEKELPKSASPDPQPEFTTRPVNVYLPSDKARVITDDDDSQFVVSLAHAQKLQDQIQRTNKPSEGPLLTKALREKMQEEKMSAIKTIQIRIRLPDQSHLEATFKSSETISDVHSFVKDSLAFPELPFRLFTSPPKVVYSDLGAVLVRGCKFGPRTLLTFEWNRDTGIPKDRFPTANLLKQEILSKGKSITEAPDVKLDIAPSDDAPAEKKASAKEGTSETKKTSWLNKGKGPLTSSQKSTLMKFVKTGKK